MSSVKRKHKGESFESLMRRFKKSCEKSNVLLEVKKREFYEKSSSISKRARDIAKKKEQKRQEEQRLHRFR